MSSFIDVLEASKIHNVSKRYIQFLVSGRKRKKGNAVWYVAPKIHNIQLTKSSRGKSKILIDPDELHSHFLELRK